MDLRRALKEILANYKIPQEMKVVDHIPRNAMGKSELVRVAIFLDDANVIFLVNKKELVKVVFPEAGS
jgi:hypothetical protein